MMISPQGYVMQFENDTFEKLIKERDSLVKEIKSLEEIVFDENKTSEAWLVRPGPDVRYQMCLDYLAELCRFISEKYNTEIVWGNEDEE